MQRHVVPCHVFKIIKHCFLWMYAHQRHHSASVSGAKQQLKTDETDRKRSASVQQMSWHFILPVRFSYLGLLHMRTSIVHPFSHAEQHYLMLMYLHYCKGRFRVRVGVQYTLIKHKLTGSIFRCQILLPTVWMGGSKIWQGSTNRQNSGFRTSGFSASSKHWNKLNFKIYYRKQII